MAINCGTCSATFTTKQALKRHRQDVHRDKPPICSYCNKSFDTLKYLDKHVKNMHRKAELPPSFPCFPCGRDYDTKSGLDKHNQAKHSYNPTPFSCNKCGQKFTENGGLKKHMVAIHSDIKPSFKCRDCDRSYSKKSTLDEHRRDKHSGVTQRFPCQQCGVVLASKSSHDSHIKKVHAKVQPSFPCFPCAKDYTTMDGLRNHHVTRHSEESSRVTCDLCGVEICSPKGLQIHMRVVHCDERPEFPCEICGTTLSSAGNLKVHQDKHGDNPPTFPCDQCDKVYMQKVALQWHTISKHSDDPPVFVCEFCAAEFTTRTGRHEHVLRKHSDNPPHFVCDHCDRTFDHKGNLNKHIIIHHLQEDSEERVLYAKELEALRMSRQEKREFKYTNNICMATMGCTNLGFLPHRKCLYHLGQIQPWLEALKDSVNRQGYGRDIMDSDDMGLYLELGLDIPSDIYPQYRVIANSVSEPAGNEFVIDIKGSSGLARAYELSVFRPDGTKVITAVIDWEMKVADAAGTFHIDKNTCRKIYGSADVTFGIKRDEIAKILEQAGMNATSTIFVWGGSLDIRCLRGTVGDYIDLPNESIDCMRPWKKALPGLPCHKLSVVYSICFPDSTLAGQRHRAEPDTRMLLRLNQLLVEHSQ